MTCGAVRPLVGWSHAPNFTTFGIFWDTPTARRSHLICGRPPPSAQEAQEAQEDRPERMSGRWDVDTGHEPTGTSRQIHFQLADSRRPHGQSGSEPKPPAALRQVDGGGHSRANGRWNSHS